MTVSVYYSCGLSATTIEYCPSLCLSVCLCVCLSMYMITQKNIGSVHLKLEHIVVYENSSDDFDIGHCLIKVHFSIYHNTNCQVLYPRFGTC